MKTVLTITILLISTIMSFGQADVKFDIFEQMKIYLDTAEIYTKVVVYDSPDTCYIDVYTNDVNVIPVIRNTYGMVDYKVKNSRYTFNFPSSSSGRVITNLSSVLGTDYKVHKVNIH